MDRKSKTIFQLDSPFTEVSWPQIELVDQQTILNLLLGLLSPINAYRLTESIPSKGKRIKKRRKLEKNLENSGADPTVVTPAPEILSHLLIGLQSITRHLESLSRGVRPETLTQLAIKHGEQPVSPSQGQKALKDRHIAAIFVTRHSQAPILHAHLPQLVSVASKAHPDVSPTRLVQLPRGCEDRLASVLGLPRVGFVAIMHEAPQSRALLDLVRELVLPIDVAWLKEAQLVEYKSLRVNMIETTAPAGKK